MPSSRRLIAGFVLGAAAVTAGLLVSPGAALSALETVADDPVLFGLIVAGSYLLRPALAWPTTPLAGVVGYGFGVATGVPIALAGVLVTVVPTFFVATWICDKPDGEEPLARVDTRLAQARRYVDRYYETVGPTRGVIVSRLAPIPSDIATVGAAAHGVSFPRFLAGTAIGELPWTVAAVTVGASAATLSGAGVRGLDPTLIVGCLLAAMLALAGPVYRSLTDQTGRRTGT